MNERLEQIRLDIESRSAKWPLTFIDALRTVTDKRDMHWSRVQNLGMRFLKEADIQTERNGRGRGKLGERLYYPEHLVPIEIIARVLAGDEIEKGLSDREVKQKIICLLMENGAEIPGKRGSNAANSR
jgi:hypothetical protein